MFGPRQFCFRIRRIATCFGVLLLLALANLVLQKFYDNFVSWPVLLAFALLMEWEKAS
jgi:hypothetical protein